MNSAYRLKADDLDELFLQAIKALYAGKEIEIYVSELDETEALLQNPANRAHLLTAVERIRIREGLVEYTPGPEK